MTREKPILFSAPMVRSILAGTKTQTRRVVKLKSHHTIEERDDGKPWPWMYDGDRDADHWLPCPYGQPGDRLLCYHCVHELQSRAEADPRVPERRLHGRVGRADLQPDEVQGIRPQGTGGLVSASRSQRQAQGIPESVAVPRERQSDHVGSPAGLHGIPRDATDAYVGDEASGRQQVEQPAGQPLLGDGGRELAGQARARDSLVGREAPCGEVHGRGAGAHSVGHQQGPMQPAPRCACSGCGAIVNSGHRVDGDRLYVRETWAAPHAYDHLPPRLIPQDARIHYAATEDRGGLRWRPSIHMPRWASRITLEITGVRVERLQDISEADAKAEGCDRLDDDEPGYIHRDEPDWKLCPRCGGTRLYTAFGSNGGALPDTDCEECNTYVKRYRRLWESINGVGSWDANPWVWVVEFRRIAQ